MALTIFLTAMRHKLVKSAERLGRLARLWAEDLLAVVPAAQRERWGRALRLVSPLVVVADQKGGYLEVGGAEAPITPETIRDFSRSRLLTLRIEDVKILRRRLSLPPAAVRRLDAALDMNLSTWTPFAASEIYAAAYPVGEGGPSPGAMMAVELRCVLRSMADERIAALRAVGLDPDAIELGDVRFTLPRATHKRLAIRRSRWLLAGLVLLLVGQSVGIYAVLAVRQRDEIEALETVRREMIAELRRRTNTEREALARQEESRRVGARLDADLSVSRALQALAAVMPQEAVVREFELGRDRAEGYVVILGPTGLDVVAILSRSLFYNVRDLSVLPGGDVDRKVFSARFAVMPWVRADGRANR